MEEIRIKWVEELVEKGMNLYETARRYEKMNSAEADKAKNKDRKDLFELYTTAYDRVHDR